MNLVSVYFFLQKSYSCADNPSAFFGTGRTVTVTLHKKDPNTFNFNFHLRLKAVRGKL